MRSYFSTINRFEKSVKELKRPDAMRCYVQAEKSTERFLYLYFKDKNERLSGIKLRYSELVIEDLRELK